MRDRQHTQKSNREALQNCEKASWTRPFCVKLGTVYRPEPLPAAHSYAGGILEGIGKSTYHTCCCVHILKKTSGMHALCSFAAEQ